MNPNASNPGITYGLIGGLILAVLLLVLYMGGVELFLSPLAYLSYLIIIVIAVMAAIRKRKANDGFLEFGEALKITFSVFAIAFLIQFVFNFILMNYIDTGFRDAVTQASFDKVEQMMRNFGASDQEIDTYMEKAMEEDAHSFKNLFLGYAIWCIVFFIISLIISAIVKRKKPEFENSFNQS